MCSPSSPRACPQTKHCGKRRVEVGRGCRDGVAERDRVRRGDTELYLADVRDHRVAGDDLLAVELERRIERRRQPQRHLDDVAAVLEREHPRRVAAVPRLVGAAEPAVDHDGHTEPVCGRTGCVCG